MKQLFSILVLLTGALGPGLTTATGQDRCGTTHYEAVRHPGGTKDQFEQWMNTHLRQKNFALPQNRIQSGPYIIPVIVHIIHNGEAVGTGTNISDAQVQSQIDVLNADYNRLNADASNTPSEFVSVAGSINIQFVLARQDPDGLPANLGGQSYGIRRVKGSKTSWNLSDDTELKAQSYWPAENYLNIWVTSLTSLLGYSSFPVSSDLAGLSTASLDRLTDGVVINYKDFGAGPSFNLDPAYNKGRTATHEIGHYFGLRHIFSEDGPLCGPPGDYVSDTPNQSSPTFNCPTFPSPAGCTDPAFPLGHKMYPNYMDYTQDACMNLFTQGQVGRFTVVLGNSPRRLSLQSSPGATDPSPVANDVNISKINAPGTAFCGGTATPQITLVNTGSNTITSVQITMTVDGTPTTTTFPLSLAATQKTTVSFSSVTLGTGNHTLSFQVEQVNGTTDGNASNNSQTVQTNVPALNTLPVLEAFGNTPSDWTIVNPDGQTTWTNAVAPDNNTSNRAMKMDLFDYLNEGTWDRLVTPAFQVVTPLTSQLKFDFAYAWIAGQSNDNLRIYALPACQPDLSQGILLYNKAGSSLATTSSSGAAFTPSTASQWKKSELVSLSSLPTGAYQLAFVSNNANGNNLYVDNVAISDNVINDLALTEVISPGLVHCQTQPTVKIRVHNFSTSPVSSFEVVRTVNNGTPVTQTFSNLTIDIGSYQDVSLSNVALLSGTNTLAFTVENPNGLPDTAPGNNSTVLKTFVDGTEDGTPTRKTFDVTSESAWVPAQPFGSSTAWQTTATNKGQSLYYPAFTNTKVGETAWFVSPTLDFSRWPTNSVFFDLSYAARGTADEKLTLFASTDCGVSYGIVAFESTLSQLVNTSSATAWKPVSSGDWKRVYVNLDTVSGKQSVRLAFVITNTNGNNVYLDNIEVFAGNDPVPPVSSLPYQLYYSNRESTSDVALTFTLPQRKDVRLQIFSVMGQLVLDNLLPDVLNQTYYFDLSGQSSGLYLFRLQIDDTVSTTKVFVGH